MTEVYMDQKLIGVISDTHGMLNPKVTRIFKNVNLIIHAGDIGSMTVLDQLNKIAPVFPVQGNTDVTPPFCQFPKTEYISVMHKNIYALHNLNQIDLIPAKSDISIVISGHTHCPAAFVENSILFLNPGSAKLPRHGGPPSIAIIKVSPSDISYQFFEI